MTNGLDIEQRSTLTIYTFHDITRETLDAWCEHYIALAEQTPSDQSYYVLMDTSNDDLSFTPYFRNRAQAVIDAQGHQRGFLAIAISSPLIQQVVSFYMRLQRSKGFEVKIFATREEAYQWLEIQQRRIA